MVTQVKDKAMDYYRGDGLTTIEKFHIVSYVNRMIIGYERHYQRKLSQYPTMPSVAPRMSNATQRRLVKIPG